MTNVDLFLELKRIVQKKFHSAEFELNLKKRNTMEKESSNMTHNFSESTSETGFGQGFDTAEKRVYVFTLATVVTIGFLGNALILVVMCSRKFENTSTSIYLNVLAVCDTLSLLSGPFVANVLSSDVSVHFDLRTVHISSCYILKFLIYWSLHLSSVCLVSITVERLIVVIKPHR